MEVGWADHADDNCRSSVNDTDGDYESAFGCPSMHKIMIETEREGAETRLSNWPLMFINGPLSTIRITGFSKCYFLVRAQKLWLDIFALNFIIHKWILNDWAFPTKHV